MSGAAPPIIASNLRIIGGNQIVAIFDLTVTRWRFCFRGCRWKRTDEREWVELPYRDCGDFLSKHDSRIFQAMALDAIRQLANQSLNPKESSEQYT